MKESHVELVPSSAMFQHQGKWKQREEGMKKKKWSPSFFPLLLLHYPHQHSISHRRWDRVKERGRKIRRKYSRERERKRMMSRNRFIPGLVNLRVSLPALTIILEVDVRIESEHLCLLPFEWLVPWIMPFKGRHEWSPWNKNGRKKEEICKEEERCCEEVERIEHTQNAHRECLFRLFAFTFSLLSFFTPSQNFESKIYFYPTFFLSISFSLSFPFLPQQPIISDRDIWELFTLSFLPFPFRSSHHHMERRVASKMNESRSNQNQVQTFYPPFPSSLISLFLRRFFDACLEKTKKGKWMKSTHFLVK